MQASTPTLFQGNASSTAVFEALRQALEGIGPCQIEEKKTSLHIKGAQAAFLGVHLRRNGIRVNIVLPEALQSPRVVKAEQVSANRWHNEIDLLSPTDVDDELTAWIQQAYTR